jgi:hypothetical protein
MGGHILAEKSLDQDSMTYQPSSLVNVSGTKIMAQKQ